MRPRRWFVFTLTMAALLLPDAGAAAAHASPAHSAAGAKRDCGVYFIGVHGINQGPNENGVIPPKDQYPNELSQTLTAFSVAMHRGNGNFQGWEFLPYPIAHNDNWAKPDLLFSYSVRVGARRLERDIDAVSKACAGRRFVLNGYSEGAWVIDCWLHGNMPNRRGRECTTGLGGGKYWNSIAGVDLYGDPQWDGQDKGLARLWAVHVMGTPTHPRALNPYIPTGELGKHRFQAWCQYKDPVCGYGDGNNWDARISATENCKNGCAHLTYVKNGLTTRGGEFLASVALKK